MSNIYGIVELPGVTVTAINPNRGNKALHDYIMGVNSMRNDIMKERGISDSRWADLSKQASQELKVKMVQVSDIK